jgi:nitrogen-specific signal transduction histidine kinase/CheY-like chemotaxis protein
MSQLYWHRGENCKKIEDKMLKYQKIESLGRLAGGIAHDFNNILTAIIGNADLAMMKLPRESPVLENLNVINMSAQRAAELARQMLAYAGRGQLVVEQFDINDLISEMLNILEVSISKKVIIRFVPNEDIQQLWADAAQIRQIVMNLVINASEAIGDNSGIIIITTGAVDCHSNYLSGISVDEELEEGRYVYFEVSDTGYGMDNETITKLFDPFFTTKFLGRGLGMSAVMGIIRRHKGAIEIHSKPGAGSCFKVLLPAFGKCSVLPENESHLIAPTTKGSGTILLVDDEEPICSVASDMLQKLGYGVLTAQNGEEALEQYRLHESRIDLVILDVNMPRMNGEETLIELKKINKNVKVILSSGYSKFEINGKFKDKGVAGFIQKPYTLDNFTKMIQIFFGDSSKTGNY